MYYFYPFLNAYKYVCSFICIRICFYIHIYIYVLYDCMWCRLQRAAQLKSSARIESNATCKFWEPWLTITIHCIALPLQLSAKIGKTFWIRPEMCIFLVYSKFCFTLFLSTHILNNLLRPLRLKWLTSKATTRNDGKVVPSRLRFGSWLSCLCHWHREVAHVSQWSLLSLLYFGRNLWLDTRMYFLLYGEFPGSIPK